MLVRRRKPREGGRRPEFPYRQYYCRHDPLGSYRFCHSFFSLERTLGDMEQPRCSFRRSRQGNNSTIIASIGPLAVPGFIVVHPLSDRGGGQSTGRRQVPIRPSPIPPLLAATSVGKQWQSVWSRSRVLRKVGRRDRVEPRSRIQSVFRVVRLRRPSSAAGQRCKLLPRSSLQSRGDWIQTSDLLVPNQRSSQAELRPEVVAEPFSCRILVVLD